MSQATSVKTVEPVDAANSADSARGAKPVGWLTRLGGVLAPMRVDVTLAFGSAFVLVIANLITPLLIQRVIDSSRTRGVVGWMLVAIAVITAIKFACTFGRRWFAGRVSIDVEASLRQRVHDHLQTLDPLTHDALSQGQIVSRTNADIGLISQLLAFGPIMLANAATLVLAVLVMAFLSWTLTIAVALMVPLLAIVALRLRNQIHPANLHAQQVVGELATTAEEAISGVRIVKAFAQEERETLRFETKARELFGSRLRIARLQGRWAPLLGVIPAFTGLAILGIGGRLALAGKLSTGELVAFLAYLTQLLMPIRMLGMLIAFAAQARAGAERVFEVLDLNSNVVDAPHATPLNSGPGAVELRNVSFEFVKSQPVLQGVSLRVEPGEIVAVVGASGSGKSTLALLLNRFFDPTVGAVLIDGQDVRAHTLESVRGSIALAFQDAFLFSDTVRHNIAAGRDVSSTDVETAAVLAGADRFIRALPNGYDTVVGEQGMTLSGGQRQRVALARAVLGGVTGGPGRGPRILVLDDATSAVDAVTESEIHASLRNAMDGRTALLIAQSRSTLSLADRVVVLDGGRIVASGTHRELLDSEGDGPERYRELFGQLPDQPPEPTQAAAQSSAPIDVMSGTGRGGPGAGTGGGWSMAATPEALARMATLPPVRDEPTSTPAAVVGEALQDVSGLSMWDLLSRQRGPLAISALLVVAEAAGGLALPALVRWSINAGLLKNRSEPLAIAMVIGVLIAIVGALISRAQVVRTGKISEDVLYRLRVRVMAHLHRLGVSFHERELSGRLLTRVVGDVDALASFWQSGVVTLLSSGASIVGVSVLLLLFDPTLALVALAALPPLFLATTWFRSRSGRSYAAVRERVATVNADLAESFNGVRVTQATAGESVATARFAKTVAEHQKARQKAQFLASIYFPIVEALNGITTICVLSIGAHRVASGQTTTGDLAAFVLLVAAFFAPVQQLVMVFDQWQQADAAVVKLRTLFNEQPDVVDEAESWSKSASAAPQNSSVTAKPHVETAGSRASTSTSDSSSTSVSAPATTSESKAAPSSTSVSAPATKSESKAAPTSTSASRLLPKAAPSTVSLELRNTSFQYGPTLRPVLRDVDLVVHSGETVALVGETGAGKSTIVKLVARFHDPTSGAVLADGHDLRSIPLQSWRRQLGYVPQEAVLFSATLADNVAYGRPDTSRARIEEVGHLVGLDRVAARLSDGYDTTVTNRGRSLSAGERQLVALARAALVDPQVLLLDEATANLDLATEAVVQRALGVLTEGRTTLLVAHRLDTARRADRIAVLADGTIVELGSHDELVGLGGRYAEMWERFDAKVSDRAGASLSVAG